MKYPDDFIDKVICGDCLEVMKDIPDNSVDLVLTDPPYNVNKAKWDIYPIGSIKEMWRCCNMGMLVFWDAYKILQFPNEINVEQKGILIWHKPNCYINMWDKTRLPSQWESIFYFNKNGFFPNAKRGDVLYWDSNPKNHPTEKPLGLMVELLQMFGGNLILDPFLGSGTTAVACKQLNRHFIGIEINPDYCKIAKERLMGVPDSLFKEV